jgi:hypothetical protein
MQKIRIGEVTIDAVIEREGPWRRPQDFCPAYDEATFKRHLQVMEPEVFCSELGSSSAVNPFGTAAVQRSRKLTQCVNTAGFVF